MRFDHKVKFSTWADCEPSYTLVNGIIILSNMYLRVVISKNVVSFVINERNENLLKMGFGPVSSKSWSEFLLDRLYSVRTHPLNNRYYPVCSIEDNIADEDIAFYSCYIRRTTKSRLSLLLFYYSGDNVYLYNATSDCKLYKLRSLKFRMFNGKTNYTLAKMEALIKNKGHKILYVDNLKLYKKSEFLRKYVDENIINSIDIVSNIVLIKKSIEEMGLVNVYPDGHLCYDNFAISSDDLRMLNSKFDLIVPTNCIIMKYKNELINKKLFDQILKTAFTEFIELTRELGYKSKREALLDKFSKYSNAEIYHCNQFSANSQTEQIPDLDV